jgi:biotin carboxylase
MKKKIAIIGAGIEQLYAYELAKQKGHLILATDNNPKAPCREFADYFILASTRNAEETLEAIKTHCNDHGNIDGVMTIANDVPYTVSLVANHFNLNGHSLASSELARNKFLMKKAFKKNNVPSPDFWKIETVNDLKMLFQKNKVEKLVLKPIDGRGSRGVLLLKSKDDLAWAFNESLDSSEKKILIAEKFISGMQLSTESYLLNGKAYTPAISERNYSRNEEFSPYIIEDGGTIPASIDQYLTDKINKLLEKGASSLGVLNGIIKGDIVIDENNEPLIIELALRLSGGWLASHQIIVTSGVDLVDVVMRNALGMQIIEDMLIPNKTRSTSVRYFFPKPGKIKSIEGEERIKDCEGIIKYKLYKKVGDSQPVVKTHSDRFGFLILEGKNREESLARVKKAHSLLQIKVD